jgi:hypothetical protein
MEKLIFKNWLSPGDIVMLTAAVRDLHRTYPGRYLTDVRTSCPALWENNPYITPLDENDPTVRVMETHYPLIHQCNTAPYHFIHGYIEYLNDQLGIRIRPTEFKGDIHLSPEEMAMPSLMDPPVATTVEGDVRRPAPSQADHPLHAPGLVTSPATVSPYWVIAAGGKYDYTIKWWHRRRWQGVVDALHHKLRFAQIGEKGHYHPPLRNVVDLRSKTTLRELIRLIYHASGVLCPVTLHMHLAAAIPLPPGRVRARGCVVVAGGREPTHWEAYPSHQFLHTIGALDCCATGGCWKSRTVPLHDNSPLDTPDNLCLNVTPIGLPRCMEMIDVADVVRCVQILS